MAKYPFHCFFGRITPSAYSTLAPRLAQRDTAPPRHTFTGCLSFPIKLFYSPSSQYAGSGYASREIQTKKGSEREMKILWADWQDQQMLSLYCISCCTTMYREDISKRANPERHPGEGEENLLLSLLLFLLSFLFFHPLPLFLHSLPPLEYGLRLCNSAHFSFLHSSQLQADLDVSVCLPSLPCKWPSRAPIICEHSPKRQPLSQVFWKEVSKMIH